MFSFSNTNGASSSNPFSTPPSSSRPPNLFHQPPTSSAASSEPKQNGTSRPEASATTNDEPTMTFVQPSAYTRKDKAKWKQSNRSVGVAVSPVAGELATYITKGTSPDPNKPSSVTPAGYSGADKVIYFTSPDTFSPSVLQFYAETYTLFSSLQRIVATSYKLPSPGLDGQIGLDYVLGPPEPQTVGHMSRLTRLYLGEVQKIRELGEELSIRSRFGVIYHILHLAQIVFLPADGAGQGLVGEELLDWVNDVDQALNGELGNEIMQSVEPWTHPDFWPYISRCLLRGYTTPACDLLRSLDQHSEQPVGRLASILADHLDALPRSSDVDQFPVDNQFLSAHHTWTVRLKAAMAKFKAGKQEFFDESQGAEFNKEFQAIARLLQGDEDAVLEQASDWKEAMGAWGLWVHVGMRRDDMPTVAKKILGVLPIDGEIVEDVVHSSLVQAQFDQALISCQRVDIWLTAHLADIFDKLALRPDDDRFDMSLRDYYLLEYADVIAQHPQQDATWRIVADYMHSAGPEGHARLKEYVLHLGLGIDKPSEPAGSQGQENSGGDQRMDVEEEDINPKFRKFQEIREICGDYGLDEEWTTIGQIMADRLVRSGEYALAATVYAAAGDVYGLSRLADKLLAIYVEQSEEEFLRLVGELPPSLLPESIEEDDIKPTSRLLAAYSPRLRYMAGFRDFVLYRQQGELELAAAKLIQLITADEAPVGIKAVLLAESIALLEENNVLLASSNTYEIMRILEEILSNASYAPEEYLSQLEAYLARSNGSETGPRGEFYASRRKLEEVRLASARNLARAMVLDINEF